MDRVVVMTAGRQRGLHVLQHDADADLRCVQDRGHAGQRRAGLTADALADIERILAGNAWQRGAQSGTGRLREGGERQVDLLTDIAGKRSLAARDAHQADLAAVRPLPADGKGFQGGDQLLVVVDHRNAVALDEALEGIVVANQRAGMGQSRPRAGRRAADLQDHHRLAGGMDEVDGVGEAVGIGNRFEDQADHRRRVVAGKPAQIVGPGHAKFAADSDDFGETGGAGIDHRDRRRARLGDQRHGARPHARSDAASIDRRRIGEVDQAHAVGAVHQDAAAADQRPQLGLLLGREAGGVDDRRPHAAAIEAAHDVGDAGGRHRGQRHVDAVGQRLNGRDRGQPGDLGRLAVHGDDRAGELPVREIVERDVAQGLAIGRGADDRDCARPDQRVHETVHCAFTSPRRRTCWDCR